MPEPCTSPAEPDPRGRPSKALRWTVEHAATEFGLDRRTLAKRLRENSVPAGADGRFGTMEICRAVFGDDPGREKDREQARHFRLRNEELERKRVPIEDVEALWEAALSSFSAQLKAFKGLSREKTNELLRILRAVKIAPFE